MPLAPRFYYLRRFDEDPRSADVDIVSSMQDLSLLRESARHRNIQKNESDSNSETATPRQETFRDLSEYEQSRQLKFKQILGVLNKLTPEKFHKLIQQIKPGPLDLVYVKMLAELIFTKVLDDGLYVQLYARLCEDLVERLMADAAICFRGLLLNLCQAGFHTLLKLDDRYINAMPEAKRYELKRKLMTLFRFLGELSCAGARGPLLSPDVSWGIMRHLVDRGHEIHLEAVFNFLFTLGLRKHDCLWPEFVWRTVSQLSQGVGGGGTCSSRLRFMFLELVEMRARGWTPRRSYYERHSLPILDPLVPYANQVQKKI